MVAGANRIPRMIRIVTDHHGGAVTETALAEHQTTRTVIGTFYYVCNQLGSGFLEAVYHRALGNTLERAGLRVEREAPLRVYFEGLDVGEFRADLVVNGRVIVEVRAVERLARAHEAQLLTTFGHRTCRWACC
jgi:GxxExxY protein